MEWSKLPSLYLFLLWYHIKCAVTGKIVSPKRMHAVSFYIMCITGYTDMKVTRRQNSTNISNKKIRKNISKDLNAWVGVIQKLEANWVDDHLALWRSCPK